MFEVTELDDGAVAVLYELDRAAPTEIMLFGPGVTDTVKGEFLFDDKAAAAVMSAYEEKGQDRLPFDIAHGMLTGQSRDMHRAAGWFKPEVRDGALWAVDIEWTDDTRKALEAREFRFFSPAFMHDKKTGRIMRLINVALTNNPATKHQQPIVLDAAEGDSDMPEAVLAALGEQDEAAAVVRAHELGKLEEAVCAALDAKPEDVAGAIASLKQAATDALAELSAFKAEVAGQERARRVEALSAAGKVPPALEAIVATFTDEQLAALEAAPAVLSERVEEPASGRVESLSDEERAACVALGLSEDDFRAGKEA